ncbi:MAG: hypothetical protein D6752_02770, partial [Candidatus Nitrosothermus koennekii]
MKTLERITLRGFQDKDIVNVVKYNNELYCIDDPLLLEKARDYRIIAEVDNEKELWKCYIENNIRNCLDPFKLLLLYKEGVITEDVLPDGIYDILEYAKDIDDSILEELEQYVRELEINRPVLLHITILIGIRDAIERLKENGIVINIKDIIHDFTNTEASILHIPNPKGVKMIVEKLVKEKEEEERKKEWEEYKARRDSYAAKQMEGSKASIVVIEENKEESNDNVTDTIPNEDKPEEEGYEPIEEKFSKVELKILLLYPEEQRELVMKFIKKIK